MIKQLRKSSIFSILISLLMCDVSYGQKKRCLDQSEVSPQKITTNAVYIQSNLFNYYENEKKFIASGNVEIYYDNKRLKAQKVTYFEIDGSAQASGNVTIYDHTNDVIITAEHINLKPDFSVVVAQGINALYKNHIKASAQSINKSSDGKTILKNVSYTPCSFVNNKSEPLWALTAEEVVDNQKKSNILYKNATLNILGQPTITVPEFQYPRPGTQRQSGFLAPEFQVDTENGAMTSVPYFYELGKSEDITIEPIFYTENSPLLKNRYRKRYNSGYINSETAFTFADKRDNNGQVTDQNAFRGSIISNGRFKSDVNQSWGFDLNRTTDDTFMRRFELGDPIYLQSRLFYSQADEYNNLYIGSYLFQTTDGITQKGSVPLVLPMVDYQKHLQKEFFSGDVFLKSNFTAIHRDDGLDTRRSVSAIQWIKDYELPKGIIFTFDNEIRGDIYHTSKGLDPSNNKNLIQNGFTTRLVPTSAAKFSLPLLKKTNESVQLIEPTIQAIWSPYGGNDSNIPNEDGFVTEFDAPGLFDTQRFYGYDLIESGPRFNTGIRYLYHIPKKGGFETQFGQSFRLKSDDRFATHTGLHNKNSDYVGRFVINYQDYIHLTHRYRLDSNTLEPNWSDITLDGGNEKARIWLSHFNARDFDDTTLFQNAEQLSTGIRTSLDKNWHFIAGYRQNVQNQSTLETRFGLLYTDECLITEFAIDRNYLRFNDIEPSTTFKIRLRLLTAGNDNYKLGNLND